MNAGHGGSSGRYDYLKEIALSYTFVLDVLGIKK
jgi:oligopeptidase B